MVWHGGAWLGSERLGKAQWGAVRTGKAQQSMETLFKIWGIKMSKKPLVNFVIDETLLQAIDDFRFKWRFDSRAAAIKWLLHWALKQKPKPENWFILTRSKLFTGERYVFLKRRP
jgi:hypothetical protein